MKVFDGPARWGRLVYVIGASGAGKDSLIAYARAQLGEASATHVFARRHITRPAESGGEVHLPITPEAFERACAEGRFALHWRGNGHGYGIGVEIDDWLRQGRNVVLNGSRAYLGQAAERYPEVLPVLIRIDPAVLRQRLAARGRESAEEIEARIRRAGEYGAIDHPATVAIDNDGALEEAGERFVGLLGALRGVAEPERSTPAA